MPTFRTDRMTDGSLIVTATHVLDSGRTFRARHTLPEDIADIPEVRREVIVRLTRSIDEEVALYLGLSVSTSSSADNTEVRSSVDEWLGYTSPPLDQDQQRMQRNRQESEHRHYVLTRQAIADREAVELPYLSGNIIDTNRPSRSNRPMNTYYDATNYNPDTRWDWMCTLMRVIIKLNKQPNQQHHWLFMQTSRFSYHTVIKKAINMAEPSDWHALILEYPHIAEKDKTRIAFTRSERDGREDRQTVTTIGKYLKRHFPALPDHEIRNLSAFYADGVSSFVRTMPEMLEVIANGAESCMTKFDADDTHPYNVYDPQYGWHMAVRKQGTEFAGRALCMDNGDKKYFVRSYRKVEGYSPADEVLEAWLEAQGYSKRSTWHGERLAHIEHPQYGGEFLAPYLDGDCKMVSAHGSIKGDYLLINDDGEYQCDRTDGRSEAAEDQCECAHCGETFDEGDGYWAGRDGDENICEYCADNHYCNARTRGGVMTLLHQDMVTYVESQEMYYDDRYMSDNNIIELATGEYEHLDNAVYLENRDEYVHIDDGVDVYCEGSQTTEHKDDCVELHDGEWCLRDDAWQCETSNEWYSDDESHEQVVLSDGRTVHSDYAEEAEEVLSRINATNNEVI